MTDKEKKEMDKLLEDVADFAETVKSTPPDWKMVTKAFAMGMQADRQLTQLRAASA